MPIVITTAGPSGRAQRLEAYQAGAWEFLGQPLDGEALLLKLDAFLRAKLEVDRVHDESLLDEVTGLYNMRGLSRRAREIGSEAFRRRHALTCVVFAPETAGLDAAAMEEVATRLAAAVGEAFRKAGRSSDAIGRLGPPRVRRDRAGHRARRRAQADGATSGYRRDPPAVDERGAPAAVELRAGYCAVPDFRDADVDATEMLLRATTALRSLQVDRIGSLRAFEAN